MGTRKTRISTPAYEALSEALAVGFWFKTSLRRFVSLSLRDHPEVWTDVAFEGTASKRVSARLVVDRLALGEDRYQGATLVLMRELSTLDTKAEFARCDEADILASKARDAFQHLAARIDELQIIIDIAENANTERDLRVANEAAYRLRSSSIANLRQDFLALERLGSPQERGLLFEGFLVKLFGLFDLAPRTAYSLKNEQIDGAFSFDTDDYILEAKWTKLPLSREQADAFAAKVSRKGKNALGLIVSINGISMAARDTYSQSTPFMTMDGRDIMHVLDGGADLDDLLRRKRRYANETGQCFAPVEQLYV